VEINIKKYKDKKQKILRKYFFEKNSILESDREIIQYFCKIIITQQNEVEANQHPSLGGIPPTIYLDYSHAVLYTDDQFIKMSIVNNK